MVPHMFATLQKSHPLLTLVQCHLVVAILAYASRSVHKTAVMLELLAATFVVSAERLAKHFASS
jgi:hypothetical protein